MKTIIKFFAILFILNLSTGLLPHKANAHGGVSFQVFYDELSPYGSWVNYPEHGYAWIPSVGAGFSPYGSGGHWVFTQFGWTWASDYSWGWAPFHYGRWLYDPLYGWIWVPDTVWGPAWVLWRTSPGYCGWAPIKPGVSIHIAYGPNYHIPPDWWLFVPNQYIGSANINEYYGPRSNNSTIINNTTVVNRTYKPEGSNTEYVAGPDKATIEKATGKPIKAVTVKDSDKPGQRLRGEELSLYRPQMVRAEDNGENPAPRKVTDLKDVKPASQSDMNESRREPLTHPKQEEPSSIAPGNDGDLKAQPSSKDVEVGPDRSINQSAPRKIRKEKSPKR
ncbi:MAG: hypothetical protein H0V65_00785 [Chitinophagales bacterium]|nr:hypothetical protein [Chitinophagales bacterium]